MKPGFRFFASQPPLHRSGLSVPVATGPVQLPPATPRESRARRNPTRRHPTWAAFVPVGSLALLLILWLLLPAQMTRAMYLPLTLSTVLFGIPHGALDHLLPGRVGWTWGRRPGWVVLYLFGYALLAALALGLWRLAPGVALWGFLTASLLHWGQGDLYHLEMYGGRRRSGWWSAPVTLLARGSLPILLPLLAFPDWFSRLAQGVIQAFGLSGRAAVGMTAPLLTGPLAAVLTVALVAVLLAYAADTLVSSSRPLGELSETGLLVLVFALVPPPLSIGTYFSLWHAWNHLARLLDLSTSGVSPRKRVGASPGPRLRLALELLPITAIALGLLGGLYVWAAPRVPNTETFVALYLALISALTLPHALLVACMDAWGTDRARADRQGRRGTDSRQTADSL